MDVWGREQLRPWLAAPAELPAGPLFRIIDGRVRGRAWSAAAARTEFGGSPPSRASDEPDRPELPATDRMLPELGTGGRLLRC
jgi:hypothetical protein